MSPTRARLKLAVAVDASDAEHETTQDEGGKYADDGEDKDLSVKCDHGKDNCARAHRTTTTAM